MMMDSVLLSSLHRVFPDKCPVESAITEVSAFQNEPMSFQMAYKLTDPEFKTLPFFVEIESDIDVSLFSVEYVPVKHTEHKMMKENPKPGLFPDMLIEKKVNPERIKSEQSWQTANYEKDDERLLNSSCDAWQSLWLIVNRKQKTVKPGKYTVTIRFRTRGKERIAAEQTMTVNIIGAKLPAQKMMYTNWFHCDCLADAHEVEIFSEEFFKIMENYVSLAVENGMNTILVPAFTPALDTPIGHYRKEAQLVKVTAEKGKYSFDFSLLKRFINICQKCGIKYFEHAHLFTQWGAGRAPMIMATVNGKYKRIFGWDTFAKDKKYPAFLRQYLPALIEFLKSEGLDKKFFYHTSDEPHTNDFERYTHAKSIIDKYLKDYMSGDALSLYEYYERGLVQTPIVVTSSIEDYYGKCDNLWAYYTGEQYAEGLSNRLILNTPEYNRIIGLQLYCYNIKGFLHWGYNYYYDRLCGGFFDPKWDPCGYNNHAGTSYFVYPGRHGTAYQSTRQRVFGEALLDVRALQLLEKKRGRQFCMDLIEKHYGKVNFKTNPESPEKLLNFRKAVNDAIAETL